MKSKTYLLAGKDESPVDIGFKDVFSIYAIVEQEHVVGRNTAIIDTPILSQQKHIYATSEYNKVVFGSLSEISEKLDFKNKVNILRPLFLVVDNGNEIRTYSAILFYESKIIFQLSGTTEANNKAFDEYFDLARNNHLKNRVGLSNQDAWFQKYHADNEIEYKLNLSKDLNIWPLANQFYNVVAEGGLKGFISQILDPFNQWDFRNYLYEVTSPREIEGYISFIECPNKTYVVKQKIFERDALERVELRTKNVKLSGSMEDYLEQTYPAISYIRHEPFSRRRYDINIESVNTGNMYSIMFDYSWLLNNKDKVLSQCEIEYLKTRSVLPMTDIIEEQQEILQFVLETLSALNIEYEETFYSKLSFLKDSAN